MSAYSEWAPDIAAWLRSFAAAGIPVDRISTTRQKEAKAKCAEYAEAYYKRYGGGR